MSLGGLVINLEANILRFTQGMDRAAGQTEQAMNRMDRSSQQTQRAMNSLQNTTRLATGALVGMMAGLSVQKLVQYSDSWTNIESRIKLVTTSSAQLASVQGQLFDIAQRNRSDMSSTVALYTRLAQSSDTLGASQKDMIKFTEGVSAAVLLSGSGTQEAAGALQQLSQAMSNANIQAQEYNSINDGAPEILRAVARNIQGVDGDLGKLRQKMLAGGLSSKEFFAAFIKDTDSLTEKSQGMAMTVGQAYTKLNNEAMKFVGEASKASGAGQMMAGTIDGLSKNLDTMAAAVGGLVTYKMSEWTLLVASALVTKANAAYTASGALATERFATIAAAEATVASTAATVVAAETKAALIASLRVEAIATLARTNAVIQSTASDAANALAMQSRTVAMAELAALGRAQMAVQAQITAGVIANTAAQTALNAANIAGAGAAGLATRALGFLGGPIGIITTVLGLGAAAWLYWGNSAKDSEVKAAGAIAASTEDILADLDRQIKKLQERNALAATGLAAIAKSNTPGADRMVELKSQMNAVAAGAGEFAGLNDAAKNDLLIKLGSQYGTLYAKIQTVNTEKAKLESSDQAGKLDAWLGKYATKAEKLAAELKKAREELGAAFTPEIEGRIRAQFAEKAAKTPKAPKDQQTDAQRAIDDIVKSTAAKKLEADAYGLAGAALLKFQLAQTSLPAQYQAENVAQQERIDLLQEFEQGTKDFEETQKRANEEAIRATEQNAANVANIRIGLMSEVDQETLAHEEILEELRKFYEKKLDLTEEYNNLTEAENKRHKQTEKDLQDARDIASIAMAGDTAGQLYSLMQKAGKEQSALGKAAFYASKALAVAEIIMNTNVAASKAGSQLGIFGIPMATIIMATGYAQAGMVAGMAIAGEREKGGPVWSGGAFLVGEKGPEIFKPSGHGTIIPNDRIGGGSGDFKLTLVTNGTPQRVVETRKIAPDEWAMIVEDAKKATIASLYEPNSKGSRAMHDNFGVQRRRT